MLRSAIALLSRRDLSRAELRGRLLRAAGAQSGEAGAEIDQVLDEVQALGLLSEDRFIREFVRVRAARFGPMRLRHDLLRRGIDEERIDAALKTHVPDEYSSARNVCKKGSCADPDLEACLAGGKCRDGQECQLLPKSMTTQEQYDGWCPRHR